jgi:hypothetical protein
VARLGEVGPLLQLSLGSGAPAGPRGLFNRDARALGSNEGAVALQMHRTTLQCPKKLEVKGLNRPPLCSMATAFWPRLAWI